MQKYKTLYKSLPADMAPHCMVCNEIIEKVNTWSYKQWLSRKYCSHKCRNILQPPPIRKGEKHPNWKGGFNFKDYYIKNRKYILNRNKIWSRNNREKTRFYCRQRAYLLKNSAGNHTLEEWNNIKKEYNYICPCCGVKEPEIKLTEDHIIPLTIGGTNNIDNIQPLCFNCNSSKNNKKYKYEKILI